MRALSKLGQPTRLRASPLLSLTPGGGSVYLRLASRIPCAWGVHDLIAASPSVSTRGRRTARPRRSFGLSDGLACEHEREGQPRGAVGLAGGACADAWGAQWPWAAGAVRGGSCGAEGAYVVRVS